MIFYKKETEKIKLVARLDSPQAKGGLRLGHHGQGPQGPPHLMPLGNNHIAPKNLSQSLHNDVRVRRDHQVWSITPFFAI